MIVECKCGNKFQSKPAPCPDGKEGCCVCHYDSKSFLCPKCGFDSGPQIGKAIMEGRQHLQVGVGVINMASITKLELT